MTGHFLNCTTAKHYCGSKLFRFNWNFASIECVAFCAIMIICVENSRYIPCSRCPKPFQNRLRAMEMDIWTPKTSLKWSQIRKRFWDSQDNFSYNLCDVSKNPSNCDIKAKYSSSESWRSPLSSTCWKKSHIPGFTDEWKSSSAETARMNNSAGKPFISTTFPRLSALTAKMISFLFREANGIHMLRWLVNSSTRSRTSSYAI